MLQNRSIPASTVIPELAYPGIGEAIAWLCAAFGFTLRLQIGTHRAQLNVGDGAVVVTEWQGRWSEREVDLTHAVMVRVEEVDAHHERATQHGARILRPPADHPYGERQYRAEDLAGHRWTFTQSIADIHPADWGGTQGRL